MNYQNKNEDYYKHIRTDVVSLISKKQDCKILEIGAGLGATLSHLKTTGIAKEVVGLDISVDKDLIDTNTIDNFIIGNVEELNLEQYNNYFDVIILADVLEHLINPKEVLEKVANYLNKGGEILISIPNFRHKSAIYKVFFKGNFSYEESGLFDYTHLRFFCKKNIKELVLNSGLNIDTCISSLALYKQKSFSKIFNIITFKLFEEFLTVQYLVRAKK
ncbi:MAG: class I SAM-dependent methyltransferase [Flavobacteriaceae bacterium]